MISAPSAPQGYLVCHQCGVDPCKDGCLINSVWRYGSVLIWAATDVEASEEVAALPARYHTPGATLELWKAKREPGRVQTELGL